MGFAELRISGFGSGCWRWVVWSVVVVWLYFDVCWVSDFDVGWYNIHYCVFAALAFCGFGFRVIRAGLV